MVLTFQFLPIHYWCKYLQKVLTSKSLFLSLSKENVFSNSWKGFTENPVTSLIKGPIQPTRQPLAVPRLETARLLLCHSVRLAGKERAYCQMEYYTILAPQKDVKSSWAVACCSRKKTTLVMNSHTLTKMQRDIFFFSVEKSELLYTSHQGDSN